MKTLTSFTPHYAEDVTYSTAALLGSYADEASLLGLLQSLHPDEWENLCERLGTQPTATLLGEMIHAVGKQHAYAIVAVGEASTAVLQAVLEVPSLCSFVVAIDPQMQAVT